MDKGQRSTGGRQSIVGFERKSSSPQIAPTICWSCNPWAGGLWSPVIQRICLLIRGEHFGSVVLGPLRTHSWSSWRPLLLSKASSPRAWRLCLLCEFWLQNKCSSSHLYHLQGSGMHLVCKTVLFELKMYCLRWKREQLRAWMLLLPLWINR